MEEEYEESNHYMNYKRPSKIKKVCILFIIFIFIVIILVFSILILKLLKFNGYKNEEEEVEKEEWNWYPKGKKIKTRWGKNLNPEKVWQEYPRPQLERKEWLNLNGPWLYSISQSNDSTPENYDGKILIPFPLESSLSGVMRNFTENQTLWYEKIINIPKKWRKKNILLHFGAVDWKCELFFNDFKIGEHIGGYSAFYFNITKYIKKGKNKIVLKVIDKTDKNYQPVGKQNSTAEKIWYTPVSGIWQTVWLEPVNEYYIKQIETNNDFDNKEIRIKFIINSNIKLKIYFTLLYENKAIGSYYGETNEIISVRIPDEDFHPWSPSNPNLYNIKAKLYSKYYYLYDSIISYVIIRKIESKRDSNGYLRIYLNNKPLFNMGTLDQGYWPDGLYTPPSEEAMIYDIKKLKDLGFNTIRKHIKIESYRYYYQCDKIGMLLWQDMPSGDIRGSTWNYTDINGGQDRNRTKASKQNYYKEWGEIIENLKFFQCIIIWVPFNEGWGQFDTEKVVNFTKKQDPSRLINSASGGNYRICGDFLDLHNYPEPDQYLMETNLINVLGEYGGLALEIKNHTWEGDNWGYEELIDKDELTYYYKEFIDMLIDYVKTGFSAAIFTQTTDVETEINGLITYDREVIKINENEITKYNKKVIDSLKE